MLPKIAYISANAEISDRRGANRRTVLLPVGSLNPQRGARAVLLDLSETGLRLQCHSPPQVSETILVDLPLAGRVPAKVIWQSGGQCGAAFEQPVSKAAVSAAILSSPPKERPEAAKPDPTDLERMERVPVRSELALLALLPLVLLLLFAIAFLPVSGF